MARIALVHDYLNQFGGAERTLLALHEIFPEAPIYTSIYDSERMPAPFRQMDIRTSYMQNWPNILRAHRYYFPFYPKAFESFDLSGYDLILSSSSAYAKGIKKPKMAKHVCYCYTPARFLWRYADYMKGENIPAFMKLILPFMLRPTQKWDLINSKDVDHFIAISKVVQDRIKSIYMRDSAIIYPPVDSELYQPAAGSGDHFLIVSRLLSYKRIDLAVKAFRELGYTLKIVGEGPELNRLKRMAGDSIHFLGKVKDDKEVAELYAAAKALVFTGEEDFGLAPLEAAACGRPAIAYGAGGAAETVIEGKTGILFKEQTADSLISAVKRSFGIKWDKEAIRKHALEFSKDKFKEKIRGFLHENKIL